VARNYFWTGGGKTEIAKIGNAKQRSTLELESLFVPKTSVLQKKVFVGSRAFFGPKTPVLQKKKSLLDFGAFSCPKHGSRHRSQGGGGGLTPCFPRLWERH